MTARKRPRSEGIRGVDRLSDLPDEVLGHILSFLPTKKAVQTSALSKRWKGVFSLATGLEFHAYYEATPFINFVDRVLSLHKVSIRRFNLYVWSIDESDVSCVNAWIVSALSLGAQELDLDLSYEMDDMAQNKLLSSCTMTVLKLKYYDRAFLKVPTSVCLSSLRVLHLERIIFPDSKSMGRFFLGCSSLTDLTLSACEWMDSQVYHVSCTKLRNLTIIHPGYHKYTKYPTIMLDLPHVVYFKLNVGRIDQTDVSCVNACIASALSPGAQQLDLELGYQMDDVTLHKLLNSCTMTVLKLKYNYDRAILKVPMSVCLSSLRVLNLERIIFPDVNSTSRFFLGCSSLTDLTLSSCEWMDGQVYCVSCAKLRNLTIYDRGCHNYTKTPTIELDLPVVVYFKCCSIPQKLFHIKNPDIIHTAELRFSRSCDKADLCFIRLMRQLSNVKILRLFENSLTVLSRIKLSKLPTSFVNLRRLEVGSSYGGKRKGWRRLPKLIARSPLLETLVFKEGLKACYSDLMVFLDDQRKPISKNHITIQVDGYWGGKIEYKLMKLFLRSAAFNLKQLVVNHGRYRQYRTV